MTPRNRKAMFRVLGVVVLFILGYLNIVLWALALGER